MKNRAFLFPLVLLAFFALSQRQPLRADSAPAKFVFVSPVQTVSLGVPSEKLTLQSQDAGGNEFKTPATACVHLSSSSSAGAFSASATEWSSIFVLTFAKYSANRNFYYKDAFAGTQTLTARVALKPEGKPPCANWPTSEWGEGWSATQLIAVTSGGRSTPASSETVASSTAPSQASAPTQTPASSSGGDGSASDQPQIFVVALAPAKGLSGASVIFEARATGLKGETLHNARIIWSFGDGGAAEGKKVAHTYHYPAAYTVLVEAASGERSATARKEIAIAAPSLVITRVEAGEQGLIELRNSGTDEVDLSLWGLRSGGILFTFPRGTVIGAGKTVPFPAAITGIAADARSAELLFPNGSVAERAAQTEHAQAPRAPSNAASLMQPPPALPKQTQAIAPLEAPQGAAAPSVPAVSEDNTETPPPAPSASSTELLASSIASGAGFYPWAAGAAGLVAVSIVGYLALLRPRSPLSREEEIRKEAAKFDIVE